MLSPHLIQSTLGVIDTMLMGLKSDRATAGETYLAGFVWGVTACMDDFDRFRRNFHRFEDPQREYDDLILNAVSRWKTEDSSSLGIMAGYELVANAVIHRLKQADL